MNELEQKVKSIKFRSQAEITKENKLKRKNILKLIDDIVNKRRIKMDKYKQLNIALDLLEMIVIKSKKLNFAFENKIDTCDYFGDVLDKVWDLVGEMCGGDRDQRDEVYDILFLFQNKDINRTQFFDELRDIVGGF